MKNLLFLGLLVVMILGCVAAVGSRSDGSKDAAGKLQQPKLVLSEAEWKKKLSPEAFDILRKSGTEPPFQNKLWNNHDKGTYSCAGCGQKLFSSDAKFESGTGWPSFYEPITKGAVLYRHDKSDGMDRTEVLCSNCGGHLGHVFEDGPNPTGLRFCMNSGAMTFKKGSSK